MAFYQIFRILSPFYKFSLILFLFIHFQCIWKLLETESRNQKKADTIEQNWDVDSVIIVVNTALIDSTLWHKVDMSIFQWQKYDERYKSEPYI